MRAWMIAAALAFAVLVPLGQGQAVAASIAASAHHPRSSHTGHLGARRVHDPDRTHYPYYLGRPAYYSPGPLFPWLPFVPEWPDNPLGW